MSLLKSSQTGSKNGSSIKMGSFDDFWIPQDNESIQKAQDFFANGMKNIIKEDITYATTTPDGYFKFNGMNIKLTQIDKLIKQIQSL